MSDPIGQAMQRLDDALAQLARETDRATRDAEIAEKMKDFEPGQKYAYAPESERLRVHKGILAERRQRGGEALCALEDAIRDDEAVLAGVLRDVQEPPNTLQAFVARFGERYAPADLLTFELLSETRAQRLESKFADATPSTILGLYERAIAERDATTIRYVEQQHGAGWRGPAVQLDAQNTEQGHTILALSRRIQETRASRITPELRAWEAKLKTARTACQRARDLHQLTPRRREHAA